MQLTSHAGLVQMLSYSMFLLVLSLTYPQRDAGLSQPRARMSQERVLNPGLLHEGLLLYQLSYPLTHLTLHGYKPLHIDIDVCTISNVIGINEKKNKYVSQTRKTLVIIDMKDQIFVTHVTIHRC